MPIATQDPSDVEHHLLKSAPPDGWVELKSMTYGEWLHRRDIATKMAIEGDPRKKDSKVSIDAVQTETTFYEFQKCVVDHNLEDKDGRKLNLGKREDFQKLHPKIGDEIAQLIGEMNAWEKEDEDEDLFLESEPASF